MGNSVLSRSALYQTITVSGGFFAYTLGSVKMNILTPWECFGFGTIFILLAILRNRIGSRRTIEKQQAFHKETKEHIICSNPQENSIEADKGSLSKESVECSISKPMRTFIRLFMKKSDADRIIHRSKK